MGNSPTKGKPLIRKGLKDFQSIVPFPDAQTEQSDLVSHNKSLSRSLPNISSVPNSVTKPEVSKQVLLPPLNNSDSKELLIEASKVQENNFNLTEGQVRRNLIANYDDECSEITEYLYVGSAKVCRKNNFTYFV